MQRRQQSDGPMTGGLDEIRARLAEVADPMTLLVGLFAHAPIGLQVYLPSGESLLTNRAFLDIFGAGPPREYNLFADPLLEGTPVLDAARRAFAGETVTLPPLWYDTPKQPLIDVPQGGAPRRCAVASTWMPLFDAAGRVAHLVILFRDVTAELLATAQIAEERDALQRTEARLQALLDHAPVAIFVKDPEGRHLVVNREAERAFGFTVDVAHGKTARQLFGEAHGAAAETSDRHVLATGVPTQAIDMLPTLRGLRPFLVTRFPIFGAGEAPIAVGDIAVDLSDRLQTEEALHKSEARFHQMFESLPMAALVSRLSDRRFVEINDAWSKLTGYRRDELVGRTSVELGLWADVAQRDALFAELAASGRVQDFAAKMHTRAGELREVLLSADTIEMGGEPCLLLIAHDVTALRELEGELRQAQKMEAIGRLAGGVAHDFNNILTAMSGADALILDGLRPEDPLRGYAEQIKRSITRAATLTRQLLTFTRKQPMQPVVVDPNEAVRGIVEMLRRTIGADVELRTELGARGCVKADPGALEQVLMNLAVNARDAMPSGGTLTLRTADADGDGASAVPPGGWVELEVQDSGTGMDAATRARVFEPFFTTKPPGQGTGLGLSTVYAIVTQTRGHISVDSEPGRGARFRILLPRVEARPPEARVASAADGLPGGRETVLLVEDDDAVREFVQFVLARLGYRVLEARDGVDALALATAHAGRIDLLLSDVVMPRMDGRELARRLRAARPELKVLHVSGYPGGSNEAAALQEAGLPMLAKPFERDELAHRVRDVLDGRA